MFAGADAGRRRRPWPTRGPAAAAASTSSTALVSLVDKSLVRQIGHGRRRRRGSRCSRRSASTPPSGSPRSPSVAAAAREAHAAAFAELAARARSRDSAADRPSPAADRLAVELDNLRAAWRYWVEARDLERLEQLEDALWTMLEAAAGTTRRSS